GTGPRRFLGSGHALSPAIHPRLEAVPAGARAHRSRDRASGRYVRIPLGWRRCGRSIPAGQQPRPRGPVPARAARPRRGGGRESRAVSAAARRPRVRRHRRRGRLQPRRRHVAAAQPGRALEGRRAGQGGVCEDGVRHCRRPDKPKPGDAGRARGSARLLGGNRPGLHRLPHQLRWLPEHARAGRHPRHERDGLPRRAPVPDPMTRYPGLVIALSWSAALAAAVVLIPGQPALGAIAIAATVPLLVLSLLVRPALIAFALVAALLAVGRAELPAVDPQISQRAAALAGGTVAMTGRVADDSRQAGGGAEVLVEPSRLLVNGTAVAGIGNLMVRWRGPTTAGFGDQVRAAGRLTLPRDMPGFDRRASLAQREVFLELQASSFDVTANATGVAA